MDGGRSEACLAKITVFGAEQDTEHGPFHAHRVCIPNQQGLEKGMTELLFSLQLLGAFLDLYGLNYTPPAHLLFVHQIVTEYGALSRSGITSDLGAVIKLKRGTALSSWSS